MDQRSWDQRRRDTGARLFQSSAGLSTTLLARVPRLAATSIRSGILALLVKMRQRNHTVGDVASIYHIVASLGQLKAIAMKMGQHLSYVDNSLTDEVRAAMAALQTHSQPMSAAQVTRILSDELGATARPIIDSIDLHPLASASIGQVHRARLPSGTRVAVKIQHEGIARALASDFGPASIATRIAGWLYPGVPVRELAGEARARVIDECDYRSEARMQRELATVFGYHDVIAIPAVHDAYSTRRVLTTDLVDGMHLDEYLATEPSQAARDRFGQALFDFYVGALLRHGILNGDPHPGNYLFHPDGKLWIVDHGCTRRLRMEGDQLVEVARVFETSDRDSVMRVIAQFGGDALLLLRLRFGLASVLKKLRTKATWRDWVATTSLGAGGAGRGATTAAPAAASPVSATSTAAATSPAMPAMVGAVPLPPTFEVVLVDPGERMIELVREVREALGVGISEAKQLIDGAPQVLHHTGEHREAEALKRRLEGSGAVVEIRVVSDDTN